MTFLRSMSALRKSAFIGIGLLLALLVASWMFVLSPRSDAVAAANDQVSVASAANDALRGTIATRRVQQAKLPELRKVEKALSGRFPPTAEQPQLFKMVTAAAGQAGLAPSAVSNLTISPPASGTAGGAATAQLPGIAAPLAQIAAQTITMDVKGTEEQIRKLVGNLEQLPRAFEVTTVSLSNAAATETTTAVQTAAITGQMFVMPTLADPTATTTVKATAKK